MLKLVALATLCLSAICTSATSSPAILVDCDAGQSLKHTLARLDKLSPATVRIKGTCTEYVLVDGFYNLTLKGLQGATLQQPDTTPPENPGYVLSVKGSHGLTITGLTLHSSASVFSVIGVGRGSDDVLLRNVTTDGSWGVVIYDGSQVWLQRVNVNLAFGFAGVAVFDQSDVHMTDSLIKHSPGVSFRAGLLVGAAHATLQGTTIRDMEWGFDIGTSGIVDTVNFDPTAAGVDVTIENPAGTNFDGAIVTDGASLNVGSAKLRITNAGQPYGEDTAGVFVTNGSTLNGGSNLVVSGSQGQGVIVSNNSHAQFSGSSITGSAHGGLVITNLSTANTDSNNGPTTISGNAIDLFCDSRSQIAGAMNIANANTVQCNNLLFGRYENLP